MKRHTPKLRKRQPARRPVKITPESPLTPYDVNAAAIDVRATSHWMAVSPEGRAESVWEFGWPPFQQDGETFQDLLEMLSVWAFLMTYAWSMKSHKRLRTSLSQESRFPVCGSATRRIVCP